MNKKFVMLFLAALISCNFTDDKKSGQLNPTEATVVLKMNPRPFTLLQDKLKENSGLIYYDGLLWNINDSGGEDHLYGVDFSGKIQKEIKIEDADNDDWEDIAQDENHIYIGDFGNNKGTRKNLVIYRIDKDEIGKKDEQKVEAKKIKFSYANQHQFDAANLSTPFDCEAFAELDGTLYLFSKNWVTQTTEVYALPSKKGEYEISPIDTFNAGGMITGADFSPDKRKLVLSGYNFFKPFLWIFTEIKPGNFFEGDRIFIEMDSLFRAQTEGVCFLGNDSLLISCEASSAFQQQVFLFDLNRIKNGAHSDK